MAKESLQVANWNDNHHSYSAARFLSSTIEIWTFRQCRSHPLDQLKTSKNGVTSVDSDTVSLDKLPPQQVEDPSLAQRFAQRV